MKLNYVKGDATKPVGEGKKLILHIVNDENAWGSGFVIAINKAFGTGKGSPVGNYHSWAKDEQLVDITGRFKLGQVQFVDVGNDTVVVNMIAQSTPGGYNGFPPIRYQSLEECLLRIRERIVKYLDKGGKISLHGPKFGSERAGGSWLEIEKIIKRVFKDVDVEFTIYSPSLA